MKKWLIWLICGWMCVRSVHAQLVLNEFYASPPAGEDEWVEIYNPSDQAVSFAGWQIAETYKGDIGNHESVGDELMIPARGFLVIVPSKLTLNNGGDTIYLYDPAGNLADSVTYPTLTSTKAYARIPDGTDTWDKQAPTPGTANAPAVDTSSTDTDQTATDSGALVTDKEGSGSATTLIATTTATGSNNSNSTSQTGSTAGAATGVSGTLLLATSATTTSSSQKSGTTANTKSGTTSTTTNSDKASSNTASPTPSPALASGVDKSWQNGIEFAVPRLDYRATSVRPTPVPQVLGAATTQAEASPASQLQVVPLGVNLPALIGALSGIIIGLGLLGLVGYLEYQFGGTSTQETQNVDTSQEF